jgi:hypothetical protein
MYPFIADSVNGIIIAWSHIHFQKHVTRKCVQIHDMDKSPIVVLSARCSCGSNREAPSAYDHSGFEQLQRSSGKALCFVVQRASPPERHRYTIHEQISVPMFGYRDARFCSPLLHISRKEFCHVFLRNRLLSRKLVPTKIHLSLFGPQVIDHGRLMWERWMKPGGTLILPWQIDVGTLGLRMSGFSNWAFSNYPATVDWYGKTKHMDCEWAAPLIEPSI